MIRVKLSAFEYGVIDERVCGCVGDDAMYDQCRVIHGFIEGRSLVASAGAPLGDLCEALLDLAEDADGWARCAKSEAEAREERWNQRAFQDVSDRLSHATDEA